MPLSQYTDEQLASMPQDQFDELVKQVETQAASAKSGGAVDAIASGAFGAGVGRGLRGVANDALELIAQGSEAIGSTSPGHYERLKATHQAQESAARKRDPRTREYPTLSGIGEAVGDTIPRYLGPGAILRKLGATGLGLIAGTSAIAGASRTPSDSLVNAISPIPSERINQGIQEAGLNLLFQGAGHLAGQATGKLGSMISAKTIEVLERNGIKPKLSQMITDPRISRIVDRVEQTFSKIPGSGFKAKNLKQYDKIKNSAQKIAQEADLYVKNTELQKDMFKQVFHNMPQAQDPIVLGKTRVLAFKYYDRLARRAHVSGTKFDTRTEHVLTALKEGRQSSLADAHDARMAIDELIRGSKKVNGQPIPTEQLSALTDVRKSLENEIEHIAGLKGVKNVYLDAKKVHMQRLDAKRIQSLYQDSQDSGGIFSPKTFVTKFNKEMKDNKFTSEFTSSQIGQLGKGLHTVSQILNKSPKPSNAVSLIGVGAVAGGVAGVGYGLGLDAKESAMLGGSLVLGIRGLNAMVTSPTGRQLLMEIGSAAGNAKASLIAKAIKAVTTLGVVASQRDVGPGDLKKLGDLIEQQPEKFTPEDIQIYLDLTKGQ